MKSNYWVILHWWILLQILTTHILLSYFSNIESCFPKEMNQGIFKLKSQLKWRMHFFIFHCPRSSSASAGRPSLCCGPLKLQIVLKREKPWKYTVIWINRLLYTLLGLPAAGRKKVCPLKQWPYNFQCDCTWSRKLYMWNNIYLQWETI